MYFFLCFSLLFGIVTSIRRNHAERRHHVQEDESSHHRRLGGVTASVPSSPDDHLVSSLPLWNGPAFRTKHWAGHVPASEGNDKHFFYWLFAPDLPESSSLGNIPLIIWLNGGPGE